MSFTLNYETLTVTLPSPVFGDKETNELQRVNRRTLGGKLISFKDASWPPIETRSFAFTAVIKQVKDDFLEFYEASAGQLITFTDHFSTEHEGYIRSPLSEIITVRDDCNYELNFDIMVCDTTITIDGNDCGGGVPTTVDIQSFEDLQTYYYSLENSEGITTEDANNITTEGY